jgi:hypothetical protein
VKLEQGGQQGSAEMGSVPFYKGSEAQGAPASRKSWARARRLPMTERARAKEEVGGGRRRRHAGLAGQRKREGEREGGSCCLRRGPAQE